MRLTLILIVFLIVANCVESAGQSGRLRQVRRNPVRQKLASAGARKTFVDFFEYVKKYEPDIVKDAKAQEKWLTRSLRKDLMANKAMWDAYMAKFPENKPDYPHNATFLGVWNQPTTYSIVSAREYDYRDKSNPNAYRTIVDVLYEWGHEDSMDNQYPGVRNLHSFIFIFEEGSWKLEDIYMYNDEFTGAESLKQYLETPI